MLSDPPSQNSTGPRPSSRRQRYASSGRWVSASRQQQCRPGDWQPAIRRACYWS